MPLVIDTTTYPDSVADYYTTETTKKNICLHATAGRNLTGAIDTLEKIDKVEVHFIIDTDGSIYQLMPLKYWAYHLGLKNTAGKYDKKTVGIEQVSPGPLVKRGDDMCFWPNDFHSKYCSADEEDKYFDNGVDWRGYRYYSTYTNEQYASSARLCAYLCYNLNIPPELFPNINEYNLSGIDSFSGIFTHTSCRRDKYDCSVSFNWSLFTQNLQTAYDYYKANNVTGLTV